MYIQSVHPKSFCCLGDTEIFSNAGKDPQRHAAYYGGKDRSGKRDPEAAAEREAENDLLIEQDDVC